MEIQQGFVEAKNAHSNLVIKHEEYTMFLNDESYGEAELWMMDWWIAQIYMERLRGRARTGCLHEDCSYVWRPSCTNHGNNGNAKNGRNE